jgi:hypothetical protein
LSPRKKETIVTSTQQPGELSEEELRVYLDQLREAEVGEIVVQAYTMLGTGAEVKLGRPDARLLIDAMAGIVSAIGQRLGELGTRMQGGVAQLQMAQVEAERRAAGQQTAEQGGQNAQDQPAQAAQQPQQGGNAQERMTDRLWIPGRDPGPRRQ